MKVLAITQKGDPLFVRDANGIDFEVEAVWVGDARFRSPTPSLSLEQKVWNEVFSHERRIALYGCSMLVRPEPLLVRPARRILVAHPLRSLADRDEVERRARALERLGGWPAEDEVVIRRSEAYRRDFDRKHPKARPSHPLETERPDPAQARRQEALRRLQDPPPPTNAEMVKHFVNGLIRRPVA